MQRIFVALLLLVSLGTAVWLWFPRQEPDAVPMVRLVPAMPIARPAEPAPAVEPAGAASDLTQRTPANPGGAPDSSALLDVHVVQAGALPEARESAVAEIDVGIAVAQDEGAAVHRQLRRTDGSGRAQFAVPDGDQRLVQIFTALGGEASVRLSATAPTQVTVRVPARCWVEGNVVDAGGRGIAAAEIVFLPWLDRGGPELPCTLRVGTSRVDGSFRVGLATGGRLGAQHRDYAPSAMHPVQLDPARTGATATLRLLLLTQPGRARGVVVAADGRALPGAALEFRAVEAEAGGARLSAPPQRLLSAANGAFEVGHLRPGNLVCIARLAGHGTTSTRFEVAAGAVAELRVAMAAACCVHGTVQDAEGAPMAGIPIWSGSEGAFDSTAVRSAADGSYRLADLPPGPTDITARESAPRTSGQARARATVQLDLVPGDTEWNAVLDTQSGPMLHGIVHDAAGSPLADWRILAQQGAASARPARTNQKGEFAVRAHGSERFDVFVYAPDQPPQTFAMAAAHAVDAAQGTLRIAVDLGRLPGAVSGIVQSHQQQPLAATISFWHHELRLYARCVADASGAFRMERVPPGTIDIYFDQPGHAGVARRDVPITTGTELAMGIVRLGAASAVHGEVVGPDGQPPENVQISILTAHKQLTAEYTAGTYRLGAVPAGKHTLQVQGPGIAAARLPLEVPENAELRQDIRLQTGVSRRFLIDVPPGSSTWVTLALRVPGESHTWLAGQSARGTATAEFLACMAPGTYEALAWGNEGLQGRTTVTFAADGDTAVRIPLQKQ